MDTLVETWSREKGYSKVSKGELCTWRGLEVEEVRLDTSIPEHEAVVLLRDLKRPECLFGWRAEAVEPGVFENNLYLYEAVKDAAESHAMVVSVNLEGDLDITRFPKRRACSPGSIAWF